MRLYPPAPIVVRAALEEVEIGGQRIARGTPISVPIYAIHRHALLWDEPDRFDPDRFAPEAVRTRDRYAYLPFGAGPRICIGMPFAMMEATAIVATFLQRARFTWAGREEPRPIARVTLIPSGGIPLRVSPR
jgi:cytochrome P450